MAKNAKEYLHSDEISEWDTVFDPATEKCEYTEEQLIRFAEMWVLKEKWNAINNSDQYDGKTRTGGLSPDTGPRT